jgi:hypothetical protein
MIQINETQLQNFLHMGRQHDKEGWVLLFPGGVGDSYIALGLLEAFRLTHSENNKINLIMPERQGSLSKIFPGSYKIFGVPGYERLWSHCQLISPPPMFHPDVPFAVHPAFIADGRAIHLMAKKGFTFADVLRHILRIPFDTSLRAPFCSNELYYKAEHFAKASGINKGESVILFPSARTLKSCSREFWIAIIRKLKLSGLNVFLNYVPGTGEELFEDVKPIDFPLELSIPLCEYAGFTISTITGTAVVNSSARARKIIIAKVDDRKLSSLINEENPNRDQYIWTMEKIGVPFDGSELFFHDEDDFEQAANLVISVLN